MTEFQLFSRFPLELRRKIWAIIADQTPRNLDIWTSFKDCTIEGMLSFQTQVYECELSKRRPPPIFRVNHESREEALKHYSLPFSTSIESDRCGITFSISPWMYLNHATDTLIPKGFWNSLSFMDFAGRFGTKLKTLAVDVNGSFWKDSMTDYCRGRVWVFAGLEELILYDSSGLDMFKDIRFVEEFRKKYQEGQKDLSFSDWTDQEPTQQMARVKAFLEIIFDKIEGKYEEKPAMEDNGEPVVAEPWLDDYQGFGCATTADEFKRPLLKLARLEVTNPTY